MTTYFDNIMKLVKEPKDLSKAPINAINRVVTNAADKYNQLQWVSNTGSKEADNYIKTPSSQQDGYQKAIGSLNPELKSKQRLYEQETKNLYDNLSGIANLREIQNHFNQIYAGGIHDTNKAYDNAQKANSLALGNARDNALSAVGGLWSNAVQSSAISAQYANKIASANLENEEKRLKDLANLRLNQANVPNVLGQLVLNNASLKSQEIQNRLNEAQLAAYKRSSGWGGGWGYRSSYGGGKNTPNTWEMTFEEYMKLRQMVVDPNVPESERRKAANALWMTEPPPTVDDPNINTNGWGNSKGNFMEEHPVLSAIATAEWLDWVANKGRITRWIWRNAWNLVKWGLKLLKNVK